MYQAADLRREMLMLPDAKINDHALMSEFGAVD